MCQDAFTIRPRMTDQEIGISQSRNDAAAETDKSEESMVSNQALAGGAEVVGCCMPSGAAA